MNYTVLGLLLVLVEARGTDEFSSSFVVVVFICFVVILVHR